MTKEQLVVGKWYYEPARLKEYFNVRKAVYIFFKYSGWGSDPHNSFKYSHYIDSEGNLIVKDGVKSSNIEHDIEISEEELSKYCKDFSPIYEIY